MKTDKLSKQFRNKSIDRGMNMLKVKIDNVPLMIHVLEMYLEGQEEAKEASVIDSNTLDTPEKLLDVMAQYDKDTATLTKLLEKLKNENGTRFLKRHR